MTRRLYLTLMYRACSAATMIPVIITVEWNADVDHLSTQNHFKSARRHTRGRSNLNLDPNKTMFKAAHRNPHGGKSSSKSRKTVDGRSCVGCDWCWIAINTWDIIKHLMFIKPKYGINCPLLLNPGISNTSKIMSQTGVNTWLHQPLRISWWERRHVHVSSCRSPAVNPLPRWRYIPCFSR